MIAGLLGLALVQGAAAGAAAEKEAVLWDKLQARLLEIDRRLDGVLAVAVRDETTGRRIEIRAGEAFAAASCAMRRAKRRCARSPPRCWPPSSAWRAAAGTAGQA